MKRYEVWHTVDELGGRYIAPGGLKDDEFDSLPQAITRAEELTAQGCCGYVRRTEDGAVLAPDNSWLITARKG